MIKLLSNIFSTARLPLANQTLKNTDYPAIPRCETDGSPGIDCSALDSCSRCPVDDSVGTCLVAEPTAQSSSPTKAFGSACGNSGTPCFSPKADGQSCSTASECDVASGKTCMVRSYSSLCGPPIKGALTFNADFSALSASDTLNLKTDIRSHFGGQNLAVADVDLASVGFFCCSPICAVLNFYVPASMIACKRIQSALTNPATSRRWILLGLCDRHGDLHRIGDFRVDSYDRDGCTNHLQRLHRACAGESVRRHS